MVCYSLMTLKKFPGSDADNNVCSKIINIAYNIACYMFLDLNLLISPHTVGLTFKERIFDMISILFFTENNMHALQIILIKSFF